MRTQSFRAGVLYELGINHETALHYGREPVCAFVPARRPEICRDWNGFEIKRHGSSMNLAQERSMAVPSSQRHILLHTLLSC